MKTYYIVNFKDKEKAKELGARWDNTERLWYAEQGETVFNLDKLFKRSENRIINDLLGEDRLFGGNELFVDLIPQSCWFTNVRYCVALEDWGSLRTYIYKRANYKCEVCGSEKDTKQEIYLEAHERWEYNEQSKTQTLKRIICLCSRCHETTHFGLAGIKGYRNRALQTLMRNRNFSEQEAMKHVDNAFDIWIKRNLIQWELNLDIITKSGIKVVRPVKREDREIIAVENLNEVV